MFRTILSVLVVGLSLASPAVAGDTGENVTAREVYINRVKLDGQVVLAAEAQCRAPDIGEYFS